MKHWVCPGCQRSGPAYHWTVVERKQTGRWWIKLRCDDCGVVAIFTKAGVHSARHADGRQIL